MNLMKLQLFIHGVSVFQTLLNHIKAFLKDNCKIVSGFINISSRISQHQAPLPNNSPLLHTVTMIKYHRSTNYDIALSIRDEEGMMSGQPDNAIFITYTFHHDIRFSLDNGWGLCGIHYCK